MLYLNTTPVPIRVKIINDTHVFGAISYLVSVKNRRKLKILQQYLSIKLWHKAGQDVIQLLIQIKSRSSSYIWSNLFV